MDGMYREQLDIMKKTVIGQDRDAFPVYVGGVGEGKSTKMAQDLKYLDPTFDHTRMCQTEKQFQEKLPYLKRYSAIALDEAFDGLSSSQVASRAYNLLVGLLQVVRQKNLFIGLALPNFFDLSKTVAIFRAKWLVQVYSVKGQRGYFKVWGRDRKRQLYIRGKQMINYHCVKPNLRGRFTKFMPVDEEAYREMKLEALKDRMESQEGVGYKNIVHEQRNKAIKQLFKDGNHTRRQISEMFGMSYDGVLKIIRGER